MEYLNIGLSVSGFVDLPKQNIMEMWKSKAKSKQDESGKVVVRDGNMNELKVMNASMFQSNEDYINGIRDIQ